MEKNAKARVPKVVQKCVMPYDQRLENQSSQLRKYSNYTFASRALEHYCNTMVCYQETLGLSISEDSKIINLALDK